MRDKSNLVILTGWDMRCAPYKLPKPRHAWRNSFGWSSTGETVAITRHGETIAHVIPARAEHTDHKQVVARFRRRRNEWQPVAMSIDDILLARHHGHRL